MEGTISTSWLPFIIVAWGGRENFTCSFINLAWTELPRASAYSLSDLGWMIIGNYLSVSTWTVTLKKSLIFKLKTVYFTWSVRTPLLSACVSDQRSQNWNSVSVSGMLRSTSNESRCGQFHPLSYFKSRHFVPRTESCAFRNRRPSGEDHLSI